MTNQPKETDYPSFYKKLMTETAFGILKIVCNENNINLNTENAGDIRPIPVYEEEIDSTAIQYTLLKHANIFAPTTISWATEPNYVFLPAYFKKYRTDANQIEIKIVIVTENYCEARFFAAKELIHCFIDDEGISATGSIREVNELIDALISPVRGFNDLKPQTIVYEIAWYGAAEFVVPTVWLPLLKKIYSELSNKMSEEDAYTYIATLVRVPVNVIKIRLK